MFACLFEPPSQVTLFAASAPLDALAREFSPRVQAHRDTLVSLDIGGLGRLLGTPAEIGEELKRAAEDRGLTPHIAIAPTRTAALLLAVARPGVVVVPPGGERQAVAPLPLGVLRQYPRELRGPDEPCERAIELLRRWGLRTLGDLAELPARPLSERLGQDGVAWRRLARGEDLQPLVPGEAEAPIEEALDLEWPVEGLEPLSFVLARVCEPLAERLAAKDLAAVALHLSCRLVSRETETRDLQLPAPMRDPKVLRTLLLLHLESHPLTGGVDALALRVDAAPARITQFSLLARARPFPEQMATLLARLSALMGESRVGAAALVDSHRPGAFAMTRFTGWKTEAAARVSMGAGMAGEDAGLTQSGSAGLLVRGAQSGSAGLLVRGAQSGSAGLLARSAQASWPAGREVRPGFRRFRVPVPARVMVREGKPVRVATDRRGLDGGSAAASAGPWRTSGDWWLTAGEAGRTPRQSSGQGESWSRDEWDVALADGGVYRIFRDRLRDRWFVDGIVD
jgi:nucleotidyltransferase/DNA polymerase involved in DNA repair